MPEWSVLEGDCELVLAECEDNFFHATICDPPGAIQFMNLEFDSNRGGMEKWVDWLASKMKEALRVTRPGGFAAVWSYPRTTFWTGLALHKAGWEIHNQLYHVQSQGMGKNGRLKPSVEPWYICRKKISEKSEKANMELWGTGRLQIDAVRIPRDKEKDIPGWHKTGAKGSDGYLKTSTFRIHDMSAEEVQERCGTKDRYPANIILGEGGVELLEEQQKDCSRYFPQEVFYCPKPTRKERELGCEDLPYSTLHRVNPGGLSKEERFRPLQVKNFHPCQKSITLLRFINKLLVPENGWILDCFAGAGSTGAAAVIDGFNFVGIDENPNFCEIARKRIEYWNETNDQR